MIRIGLAGWGDHQALYPPGTGAQDKLKVYGRTFPIVEVDSSFYAVCGRLWVKINLWQEKFE